MFSLFSDLESVDASDIISFTINLSLTDYYNG